MSGSQRLIGAFKATVEGVRSPAGQPGLETSAAKATSTPRAGTGIQAAGRRRLTGGTLAASCILVATTLTIMGSGYLLNDQRSLVASGTIEAKEIPVASKTGGRIARVMVQEGDFVEAGQPLLELDLAELDARKGQSVSQLKKSEARLLQLRNGPRQEEIGQAEAVAAERFFAWKMLENGSRPEEIAMAQAERRKAESELDLLERGYRKEEISQAKAAVTQAKAHLEWTEKDWRRFSLLSADGAVSDREADDAKAKFEEAQSAYQGALDNYDKLCAGPRQQEITASREALQCAKQSETMTVRGRRSEEIQMARHQYLRANAALQLLKQGTRVEELAQAEADVHAARAAVAEIDALLKDHYLVSPAEAEVTTLDLHEGQVIAANKPIAKLTRLDDVWTRIYIPERELSRVRIGQTVRVKADAYPQRELQGKIVQIPSLAEFTPRNVQTPDERADQVFGIKVAIDNNDRLLRGGMNAEVSLSDTVPCEKH